MSTQSRVNYGTVEFELAGKTRTLKPTLLAMDRIMARWEGGLREALAACDGLGARELSFVLAAGLGLDPDEAKELPDEVFNEGTANVAPAAIKFLTLLINPTGKTETDEKEKSSGE